MPPKKSKKPLTQQICDQLREDVKKAEEHPENKVKNPQSIYSLKQDSKVLTKLLEECLNKFPPKQLKIVVNEKEVATSPKFWNWLSSHEIHLKNGKVLNKKTNIGKYLFVYFVISQSPSDHEYKANRDEDQNPWSSVVKFTADNNLLYNGEPIFIRAIESIPTVLVGPSSSSTTGRWPNEKEGSDHTALWACLTMTPSTGTIGSEQITFQGFTFNMLAPAAKMNHKPIDPIYICRAAQISSEQAWAIPTLLVTERTWNVIKTPQMTHIGAFGNDYETIGAIGNDRCVICWKFPGDMFLWPLKWNKHLLQLPLPVGEYLMNNDEWSKIRVENIDPLPLDEPMMKMRVKVRVNNQSIGMHYLQKTEGGDETKVVMLGFQYFVSDLWEEDNAGQSKTGAMLTKLQEEQKITGFANHTQHHAIVMYSYEDESGKKRILSPVTWHKLLKKTERFDAILNTLLSGSPKHMHEDLTRLIEAWRDCDLTEAPFLP